MPTSNINAPTSPPPHRRGGLRASFGHAWTGLIEACRQRNMRLHLVSALLVGLVGSSVPLGLAEKVALLFCVMLVFFAEVLNTALEALVDLHTERFHEQARRTKDAAAAVLVLAAGTVVIFAAICVHSWHDIVASLPLIQRQAVVDIPLVGITATLLSESSRARVVDHLLFAGGSALCIALFTASPSTVFAALTAGMLTLAWRVSAFRPHAPPLPRLSERGAPWTSP